MTRSLIRRLALLGILLLYAAPVYADGPEPAFFVYLGIGIFCVVQVWVVTSEFIYLTFLFKALSKLRVLWWTVLINLGSSVVGIIPQIIYFQILLVGEQVQNIFVSFALFVVITYPITVVVEGWLLYLLARRSCNRRMRNLVAHSFGFNAVSYSGLLLLLAWLYL